MEVCVARRCYTGSDPSRRMPTIEAWLLGEDLPSQPGNIAEIPTVALQLFLRSQLSPQHLHRLGGTAGGLYSTRRKKKPL